MSTNTEQRQVAGRILDIAKTAVTTVRGGQHGDAQTSFEAVGRQWFAYLNNLSIRQTGMPLVPFDIQARDVAFMMGHMKEIRVMFGDEQQADNYVDYAGYGSLAGMFHVPQRNVAPASGLAPQAPEQATQSLPSFLTNQEGINAEISAGEKREADYKGKTGQK